MCEERERGGGVVGCEREEWLESWLHRVHEPLEDAYRWIAGSGAGGRWGLRVPEAGEAEWVRAVYEPACVPQPSDGARKARDGEAALVYGDTGDAALGLPA